MAVDCFCLKAKIKMPVQVVNAYRHIRHFGIRWKCVANFRPRLL